MGALLGLLSVEIVAKARQATVCKVPFFAMNTANPRSLVLMLVAISVFTLACEGEDSPPAVMVPDGCDAFVVPGDDDQTNVQTALLTVEEGQTLCLDAGTFMFVSELSLAVDGVTVRGAGREATTLDFSMQDSGGNGLAITSDGVTIEALTVLNTPGDGIRATDVMGITFRAVGVVWDGADLSMHGAYGLYPVGCTNVLIEDCLADGARDAGIYVGQSNNIIVRRSTAINNVAGIEIENSITAEVYECEARNNTAGLAIFDLPGLAQYGSRTLAHSNVFEDNNTPNFGAPGTAVSMIPPGLGMFILASDLNEVRDNMIADNGTAGVAIVSHDILFGMEDDPNFDTFPSGNWVHSNTFMGNGTAPQGVGLSLIAEMYRPIDIFWGGCAAPAEDMAPPNCFNNNGDATYYNRGLCGGGDSTDLSAVDCMGMSLPAVELP